MKRLVGLAMFTAFAVTLSSMADGVPIAAADGPAFDIKLRSTREIVPAGTTASGGTVEIEVLSQPGGCEYLMFRVNVLVHDRAGYSSQQWLEDLDCANRLRTSGDGKTIIIAFSESRYSDGEFVHEWVRSKKSHRFVKTRSYRWYPYREQAREVEKLLTKGKLDQALKRLEKIGTDINGTRYSLAPYWFMRFMTDMRPHVERLYRAGKKREAAALLGKIVDHDVFSGVMRHKTNELLDVDLSYFPCCNDDPDARRPARRSRGPLKKTVYELNEAGHLLQQGGRDRAAAVLLQSLVAKVPQRTVAHLNLADSLWNLNQTAQAKRHYRTYAQQRRKAGKSIPKRVGQRVGR